MNVASCPWMPYKRTYEWNETIWGCNSRALYTETCCQTRKQSPKFFIGLRTSLFYVVQLYDKLYPLICYNQFLNSKLSNSERIRRRKKAYGPWKRNENEKAEKSQSWIKHETVTVLPSYILIGPIGFSSAITNFLNHMTDIILEISEVSYFVVINSGYQIFDPESDSRLSVNWFRNWYFVNLSRNKMLSMT